VTGDKDSMDSSLEELIFQEIRKKRTKKTSVCVLQLWAFHAIKIRKKEELCENINEISMRASGMQY